MKKMMRKIALFMIIVLCSVFFAGCWDNVEIDRKSLISTISIDPGKDISKEKELKEVKPEEPFNEHYAKKLKMSFGFPDISELGPSKGNSANEKSITSEGYSVEDCISEATLKSSRSIELYHGKTLIINEQIFKYPEAVKEILDYFERNPRVNKSMYVIVTDGSAEDLLKYKPDMEKNVENYISGLMHNSRRNAAIKPVTLSHVMSSFNSNTNVIIPKLTYDKNKNELSIGGADVIENYEYKGTLSPVEVLDLDLMRGEVKGGKKVIYKNGHPVDIYIIDADRRVRLKEFDGEKMTFNINIEIDAQLDEYNFEKPVLNKKDLGDLEKEFNKSISEECEKIAKAIQQQYGYDIIGVENTVKKSHPFLWKKIKKKWPDIYKNSNINVKVTTDIRRMGESE